MALKFWKHLTLRNGDKVQFVPPLASASQVGGGKAVAATEEMTASVGIDDEGNLKVAPGGGGVDEDAVHYTADAGRTSAEKTQARTNIGAADADNVYTKDKVDNALEGKVDKVAGKGLSTNDYDDTEKANVAANTAARHTHENKDVLDDIISDDLGYRVATGRIDAGETSVTIPVDGDVLSVIIADATSGELVVANALVADSGVTVSIAQAYTNALDVKVLHHASTITPVSWSTGTDAEITAFLQLADQGKIDLTDYWNVGDTRVVHLQATEADADRGIEAHAEQDIELVLLDSVCDGFTVTGTNHKPHFIVGTKNGLLEKGKMNASATNEGGWADCQRRSWCNTEFRNALPSTMREWFKQFTWSQGAGGGVSSGIDETNDYFGLTPEQAIFGTATYSIPDEAALYSQWDWYKTSSNRIKKSGAEGSVSYWWCGSPCSDVSWGFCDVYTDGHAARAGATNSELLAPFGCI